MKFVFDIMSNLFFSIEQDADVPDENDSRYFGASRPTGIQTYYTSRRRGRWKRNAGFGTSRTGCQQGSGKPSPGRKRHNQFITGNIDIEMKQT